MTATASPHVRVGTDRATLEPFATLGDFLGAVRGAAHGEIDRRLYAGPSGMNQSVGSEGGFLVPEQLADGILTRAWQQGQILRRVRPFPLAGTPNRLLKINAFDETNRADGQRLGGVQVYWLNEAGQATGAKPKLRQLALDLSKKIVALYYLTTEAEADATPAQLAGVEQGFVDEIVFAIEEAIVNGSGAGQPLGLTKSPATITVTPKNAASAGSFFAEDAVAMFARAYLSQAPDSLVWLVNQAQLANLLESLLSGTSSVAAQLYDGTSRPDAPFGTLASRPILPSEHCAAPGTVGDVILTDLAEYVLADRGTQHVRSIHVRFLNDEVAYRITLGIDGQPIWKQATTPKNGTNTVSPIVVLGAR